MTELNIGLDQSNVTGPQFHTLHVMFEEQYREMWAALDEIAERVRALGVFAEPTSPLRSTQRSLTPTPST